MIKRVMLYVFAGVLAGVLSLSGFVCLGGCEHLEPSLDGFSSRELMDELVERGFENWDDWFGDDE